MDPKIGQIINNKYRLVRLIGDGGMGSVFEAEHELLGTTVALKFLHTALSRRKGLVDRFLQEAQVSARIKSAHVVRVSDVDRTPDGLAYMVMEYVEGKTLQRVYEDLYEAGKRLSYGDAFAIMVQLLDGVAAAHKRSIVHRDLKPDNVMISRDSKGRMLVKILDFGIAKLKASGEMDRGLTRPGVVMGTPEYMAPEQAFSADKVDARADIFSLGVMFFEMLAGRRPVGGDNAHAIAAQYLEGKISRLRDLKPAIAEELAAAVHRAMEAEPKERFATVAAFRKAIESFSPTGPGDGMTTPSTDLGEMLDLPEEPESEEAAGDSGLPKTVPPEETFSGTPPAVSSGSDAVSSGAVSSDATPGSGDGPRSDERTAAMPVSGEAPLPVEDSGAPAPNSDALETRVAAAVTSADADEEGGGVDPLGATADGETGAAEDGERTGTDAMPVMAPMDMARAGTEQMPAGAAPLGASATVVGADEAAAPAPAPAPMVAPFGGTRPVAAPGRGRSRRRGPSIFTILLVAATVAGAVVGGVYLAHRASEMQDASDDPPVLQLQPKPPPKKTTAKPGPEPRPTVVPPPVSPTPASPRPPTPRPPGPGPAPTPTPTSPFPFPTMLPSALPIPTGLPTGFPFPGQQPQPQPGPSPQPQPGPSPQPSPGPTIPKLKFPIPKP